MRSSLRSLLLALTVLLLPLLTQAQSRDSVRSMLYGRSGGFSRQFAIGGGGFGIMGSDSTVSTLTTAVNPFSVDPLFILTNSAWATHYSNYLSADIGSETPATDDGTGQQFTALFDVGQGFTAGGILSRRGVGGVNLLSSNIINRQTVLASQLSPPSVENAWELIGAYHTGGVRFGLGLSLQSNTQNFEVDTAGIPPTKNAYSQFGLNLGALIDVGDASTVDLGVSLLFPSLAVTATSETHDIKYTVLGVNARMLIEATDNLYLVPLVSLYSASGTTSIIDAPKDLASSTSIDVGFGINYFTGAFHFVGGPSFGYYTQSTPKIADRSPLLTNSEVIFPRWNLGAEWQALSWLTARLGYFASSASRSTQLPIAGSTTHTSTSTITVYNLYSPVLGNTPSGITLGAGFHFGRFTLDAAINEAVLRLGLGNLASGRATFAALTASYSFE